MTNYEKIKNMNIDENVMKILVALLRKWKVIVLFAVIGAIVYLVFFVCLSEKLSFDSLYKRLSSIFMTCALVLTSVAHTVNITVLSNGFKSAHTG